MKPPAALDVVAARHAAILDAARRTGSVGVDDLAQTLAVTPQTIRKDLNLLAPRSMLARVHGGAVVTSGTHNLAYRERRTAAAPAEAAIAAAAALVPMAPACSSTSSPRPRRSPPRWSTIAT